MIRSIFINVLLHEVSLKAPRQHSKPSHKLLCLPLCLDVIHAINHTATQNLHAYVYAANPLVADSPGALGAQEIELAERLGKTQEASSDDLQKDPVLSSFLDELSGRVNKRPVAEYEGKMQPVSALPCCDVITNL